MNKGNDGVAKRFVRICVSVARQKEDGKQHLKSVDIETHWFVDLIYLELLLCCSETQWDDVKERVFHGRIVYRRVTFAFVD